MLSSNMSSLQSVNMGRWQLDGITTFFYHGLITG